jgi:hypothetical protein
MQADLDEHAESSEKTASLVFDAVLSTDSQYNFTFSQGIAADLAGNNVTSAATLLYTLDTKPPKIASWAITNAARQGKYVNVQVLSIHVACS